MTATRKTAVLTGWLLAASTAWGFQPLITDDTGTQGQGENQLEFSFSHDRVEQGGLSSTTRVLPLTYTRGLSETVDIAFSVNHTSLSTNAPGVADISGSGNPVVGLKWRFHENEASKTSFALKGEVSLPVDQNQEALGLGSAETSYTVTAILAQETSFGAVLANIATGRTRYHDTLNNPDTSTVRLSIAPVWQITEQWKMALDLGTEIESAAGNQTHTEFLVLGIVYSPDKDIDVAFGLTQRNDHSGAGSTGVSGGVTWRFR